MCLWKTSGLSWKEREQGKGKRSREGNSTRGGKEEKEKKERRERQDAFMLCCALMGFAATVSFLGPCVCDLWRKSRRRRRAHCCVVPFPSFAVCSLPQPHVEEGGRPPPACLLWKCDRTQKSEFPSLPVRGHACMHHKSRCPHLPFLHYLQIR